MNHRHVEENAELYALGALDDAERADVEAQAASCAACAASVARAERMVAGLDDAMLPPAVPPVSLAARLAASARAAMETPPRTLFAGRPLARRQLGAVAAAFAVVLGAAVPLLHRDALLTQSVSSQGVVLQHLVASHFRHSAFAAIYRDAPRAKAIYSRDGDWLVVIVDSSDCRCTIVADDASGSRDLGSPHAGPGVATLFAANAGKPRGLRIVQGGVTRAIAALAY